MSKPFHFALDWSPGMEGGSGLFGTPEVQPTRLNGIRLNEAVLGTTIPIVIGQQRISWKLLWYGDFSSKKASTSSGGGSGMGKGGTQYVYSASVVGSVCHGPCSGFLGVWSSMGGGKFAVAGTSESGTVPPSGGTGGSPAYTPTQATIYAQDLGVSFQRAYSVTVDDYGSPGSAVLSGTQNVPLHFVAFPGGANPSASLVSGQYSVDPATNLYYFSYADIGDAFTVNYVYYQFYIADNELATVPLTGSYQVTVTYQTQFTSDNGVRYYPSGVALTRVGGTPSAAGTYNPNGGNYLFAAADAGLGVEIFYTYMDQNTDSNAPTQMNLTFFDGAQSQSPWSYLSSAHPNFALGYTQIAYIASSGMYLGYSAALPQLNFEILGIAPFGGGIPDANPADAIAQLLTNPAFGVGFPSGYIDASLGQGGNALSITLSEAGNASAGSTVYTASPAIPGGASNALANQYFFVQGFSNAANNGMFLCTASTTTTITLSNAAGTLEVDPATASYANPYSVYNYWGANSFFLSALLDSQTTCMDVFGDWLEAGQAYITWDAQKLKFIPLGDTSAVANKLIYNPPTQPVVDLDDSDFMLKEADDPIKLTSAPWQSRWNRVAIRWSVRENDYNEDCVQVQDDARIQIYGLMVEQPKDYQFITTSAAANFAANMRLQRLGAIYTKYEFTLKSNFAFLSPGDIITITDGLLGSAGYLFGRTPVRITKMTDSPAEGIKIEAETFPWSVGSAYLYNAQAVLPSNTSPGPQADPGNTTALLIEVPNEAQQWTGNNVFVYCNGSQVNWGGCEVFVSLDGTTYNPIGNVSTPARLGITTADFPYYSGANPDTADTLSVNMQQSGAVLNSVGASEAAMYATQSAVVSAGTGWTPLLLADEGFNLGVSTMTSGGTAGPLTVTSGADSGGSFAANFVQIATGAINSGGNSPLSVTLPNPVTVGNAIIIGYNEFDFTNGFNPTVSDSLGNTYHLVGPIGTNSNEEGSYIIYGDVTTGGSCTITFSNLGSHIAANNNKALTVVCTEFSGLVSPVQVDTAASFYTGGAAGPSRANSGTITTTNPNDIIFTNMCNVGSQGQPSGFTLAGRAATAPSGNFGGGTWNTSLAYQAVGATGTYSPTWTGGGSSGNTVAFKVFDIAWSNANNVTGTSGYATATCALTNTNPTPQPEQFTHDLNATFLNGGGFSLPTSSSGPVSGVTVTCSSYVTSWTPNTSGNEPALIAQLLVNGAPSGEQKIVWEGAGGGTPTFPTAPTTFTLGSATDLWDLPSLSANQINLPTFGVQFFGAMGGDTNQLPEATVAVNDVQMTVTYVGGSSGTPWTDANNVTSTSSYASSTFGTASGLSLWLVAQMPSFMLPFGFILKGVEVEFEAYSTDTGSPTVYAQMYYNGVRLGSQKSAPLTTSNAVYDLGGTTDNWGVVLTNTAVNSFTPVQLNSGLVGVALLVSAATGTTQYIRNVNMTVYGESAYNLELLSYETATLTGVNTYDLTTVYRGILGSYPADHPAGSTFVRMDNASLVFQVPANFQGTTLYFKFCSYNAYGNQLQSLADVSAESIVVNGLAPGAVDNISGILQSGTPQNPEITSIDSVITAAHGPYQIGNIPAGYAWLSSGDPPGGAGYPTWQAIITGGGGSGTIQNIFVIKINGNYPAQPWDYLAADTTGGNIAVTLPSAAAFPNVEITVTKTSSDANSITISPNGSDTVGGQSSQSFVYQNTTIDMVSDGVSNWILV